MKYFPVYNQIEIIQSATMPLTEEKYKSDWDFLKCVYSLLDEGNVLNTTSNKPVITFKFPDELKVTYCYIK